MEKVCALYLDEMEITQGYELEQSQDILLGGMTLLEKHDELANHALVFMVGGLNTHWKQVITYHFTGSHVDGLILKNLVLEIIQQCMDVSLRVFVVSSDMGACNRAMWRQMNFSSHRSSEVISSIPHPCLEDIKLYFMADPAYVLKNICGQLINSITSTLSDKTVTSIGLQGSKVDIEHVQAAIDFDSRNEFKCTPKLSSVHVSGGHFIKMRVGAAVKLFRESPAGIRYLVEPRAIEKGAEITAWFMELISKWITLMSSRHPTLALSKLDSSKQFETLELIVNTVRGMKMGGSSHWKPSQAGLIISIHVVVMLQHYLLDIKGYTFFLTSRLLQDCLENLFPVIRLRKPAPNAYDLKYTLKLVCISQFLYTPGSTSYDVDDRHYLADLLSQGGKSNPEVEPGDIDDSEILFIEELLGAECEILFHVGGVVLRPILKAINHCEQCEPALLGSQGSRYASLTKLKEYVSDGHNLTHLINPVMNILKNCEEHF